MKSIHLNIFSGAYIDNNGNCIARSPTDTGNIYAIGTWYII